MSQSSKTYDPIDNEIEEDLCPLCVEEMDLSDKNFIPCPCGYRVCMWCWHHIKENLNGLCPACRTPYEDDPHAFAAVDTDQVVKKKKEKKHKKGDKKGDKAPVDKRSLHNVRVIQRNLVYVIGLPLSIASEEDLRRGEYFGQYGRILKVVVNHNHGTSQKDYRHGSASAYITFSHKEDAKAAIQAIDGYSWDGRLIRASFGTTKYCNNFLRNLPCTNPECLYLHELGESEDRFTKEEIQTGASKSESTHYSTQTIVGEGGPSGTGKRVANSVFPPPVFEAPKKVSQAAISSSIGKSQGSAWGNVPTNNGLHPAAAPTLMSPLSNMPPLLSTTSKAPAKCEGNDGGSDKDRTLKQHTSRKKVDLDKTTEPPKPKAARKPLAAPPGVAAATAPPGVPVPPGLASSTAPPGVPPPASTRSNSAPPGVCRPYEEVVSVDPKPKSVARRRKNTLKEHVISQDESDCPKAALQEPTPHDTPHQIKKKEIKAEERNGKQQQQVQGDKSKQSKQSKSENRKASIEKKNSKGLDLSIREAKEEVPKHTSGGTGFGSMLIGSAYSDIWSAGVSDNTSEQNLSGIFGSSVFSSTHPSSKSANYSKKPEADLTVNPFQKTDFLKNLLGIPNLEVDSSVKKPNTHGRLSRRDDTFPLNKISDNQQAVHSLPTAKTSLLNNNIGLSTEPTFLYEPPMSSTSRSLQDFPNEGNNLFLQESVNKPVASQSPFQYQQINAASHSIGSTNTFNKTHQPLTQGQDGLQSGMALLQKMLPNVNVSFGESSSIQSKMQQPQQQLSLQFQENMSAPNQQELSSGWGKPQIGSIDPGQAFGASMWTMAPESTTTHSVGWGQPKTNAVFHQSYDSDLPAYSNPSQSFNAFKGPEASVHAHGLHTSSYTPSRMGF